MLLTCYHLDITKKLGNLYYKMSDVKYEDTSWTDLSPARQVEIVLCRVNAQNPVLDQVYILEAYLINQLGANDGFLGIIMKTYGLRLADTLNNTYEIVYHNKGHKSSGSHSQMLTNLVNRVNVVSKKKLKRGYKDASLRMDLHIPALHKNSRRFGNRTNSVPGTFLKNDIAHSDFEDKQVGSFINIL